MLTITPIPAFTDNYIWALHQGQASALVDPGDAAAAKAWLEEHGQKLIAILCTHHHNDHTGGIAELTELYNVPAYGPRRENIPGVTHPVNDGERIDLAELGADLTVLEIPGHTRGHIAYYTQRAVFCGDTLFGAGCGRMFEGTAPQFFNSLQRLTKLPDDTLVYCAHEYTEANLRFALAVEPGNAALIERARHTRVLRANSQPTLPSTLALEKATNPFLRCGEPEIVKNAGLHFNRTFGENDEVAVFAALREWKNTF